MPRRGEVTTISVSRNIKQQLSIYREQVEDMSWDQMFEQMLSFIAQQKEKAQHE